MKYKLLRHKHECCHHIYYNEELHWLPSTSMTEIFNFGLNAEVLVDAVCFFKRNFKASNKFFPRKNGITTSRTSSFAVEKLSANEFKLSRFQRTTSSQQFLLKYVHGMLLMKHSTRYHKKSQNHQNRDMYFAFVERCQTH